MSTQSDSTPSSPQTEKDKLIAQVKSQLIHSNKTTKLDPLMEQEVYNRASDRRLKSMYAKWFIGILIFQLIVMQVTLMLNGFNVINVSDGLMQIYLTATLAEVFGVVLVITKNLFPGKS